jgi:hypothetical protein
MLRLVPGFSQAPVLYPPRLADGGRAAGGGLRGHLLGFEPKVESCRGVNVEESSNGVSVVRERVRDVRWHEHERAGTRDNLLAADVERELSLEDVEGVVLGGMRSASRVPRGAAES